MLEGIHIILRKRLHSLKETRTESYRNHKGRIQPQKNAKQPRLNTVPATGSPGRRRLTFLHWGEVPSFHKPESSSGLWSRSKWLNSGCNSILTGNQSYFRGNISFKIEPPWGPENEDNCKSRSLNLTCHSPGQETYLRCSWGKQGGQKGHSSQI